MERRQRQCPQGFERAQMRDRVSHGYDAIDYATLWDTVHDDVPGLLVTVEQMLKELDFGKKM